MAARLDARMTAARWWSFVGLVGVAGVVGLSMLACSGSRYGTGSSGRSPMERNADCCMCHQPFLSEPFSVEHAEHGIACADCHGPSVDHSTDERFETPPDRMFEPAEVDDYCRECHEKHKASPAEVARRWVQVAPASQPSADGEAPFRCTVCHGQHRLAGESALSG